MYVYGFRFYFTPLTGVLFAFPSRYWFTIGQLGVFSLGGWSPHVQSKFHVLRPTRFILISTSCTGLSPCIAELSSSFHYFNKHFRATPLSLAATQGISVDFYSYGYLDVSVLRVCLVNLCIQLTMTQKGRVSPFGHLWLKCLLLAHHSFSQVSTSFVASNCQGIHRIRLFT